MENKFKREVIGDDSGYVGSPGGAEFSNSMSTSTRVNYDTSLPPLQGLNVKSHVFGDTFFKTPILCQFCNDFIWGTGRVGVKCEDCQKCFHKECIWAWGSYGGGESSDLGIHLEADENEGDYEAPINNLTTLSSCSFYSSPPSTTSSTPVGVGEWSVRNVVEWMAVVNLWDYAQLFIEKEINGAKLVKLNNSFLESIGVDDEFGRESLLECRNELIKRGCSDDGSDDEALALKIQRSCLVNKKGGHHFTLISFTQLTTCNFCSATLIGLFHQGLICQKCGYIVHRKCAVLGLPSCSQFSHEDQRLINERLDFIRNKIFGESLSSSFDPISELSPPVLISLCSELERRLESDSLSIISNLAQIFSSSSSSTSLIKTLGKNRVTREGFEKSVLRDLSTGEISRLIRRYLRELPEPLVPTSLYEEFMVMAKGGGGNVLRKLDKMIAHSFDPHHARCIRYFGAHLGRVSQFVHRFNMNHPEQPPAQIDKILSQFYAMSLLRPSWENTLKILDNTSEHMRVISLLIELHGGGGGGGGANNSSSSSSSTTTNLIFNSTLISSPSSLLRNNNRVDEELETQDYYWGNTSKEEVFEKLWDAPDGSFILRDASTKNGEFTLTVRHNQSSKLLRISHHKGKYGLIEPYTFPSVVSLVNHYREHSLSEYNNSLNVKLLYPISKYEKNEEDEDKDKLFTQLADVSREYLIKSQYFEMHTTLQSHTSDKIHLNKQGLEAFEYAISFFRDHLQLHAQTQQSTPLNDPKKTKEAEENYLYLKNKLESIEEGRGKLVESLNLQRIYQNIVESELVNLKPILSSLHKQRARILKRCEQMGYNIKDCEDVCTPSSIDVWDEEYWFLSHLSRLEAESLLNGKPDATFLVRKSTTGELALSLVLPNEIGHCIIYQGAVGFGFGKEITHFPTLKALIVYYSAHSLEDFNPKLKTRLKYPVRAVPRH